jgi:hypothetical protein
MGETAYTTIEDSSGQIEALNSFSDPQNIKRNQLSRSRNWIYTKNGIRTRFGSLVFKNNDNRDTAIRGNIIFNKVYSRDQDSHYFHFLGTDLGYLYFAKFSSEFGIVSQIPVTDLSLSDYPVDTILLDLQNDSSIITELNRVRTFQWAVLRAHDQTIGSYWDLTPAFTPTGSITSAVLNNKIFFADGTPTLHMFDGVLGTGRKLTQITISNSEFDSEFDNIVKVFTFNNALWLVTDTDKFIRSAPGDGTTFTDLTGVVIKIGRLEGMDVVDIVKTQNGVFIGLTNPTIKSYQTKILTGSSADTYRIDDVDNTAGIIGSSGQQIGQDFIALTDYGFVNITAFGQNDRFGLTQQKSISADVLGDIFEFFDSSVIDSTFYSGVQKNKRNWFVCQVGPSTLAIFDANFSDISSGVYKWTFFDYPFTIKTPSSLVNRLFITDNQNNILMTDVPNIFQDNNQNYKKEVGTCAFGASLSGRDAMAELIGIEKQFKQLKIPAIIPGQDQTVQCLMVSNGVPLTTLPGEVAGPTTYPNYLIESKRAETLLLSSEILLSTPITLGSFEYESQLLEIGLADSARTAKYVLSSNVPLDLEIFSFISVYEMIQRTGSEPPST